MCKPKFILPQQMRNKPLVAADPSELFIFLSFSDVAKVQEFSASRKSSYPLIRAPRGSVN